MSYPFPMLPCALKPPRLRVGGCLSRPTRARRLTLRTRAFALDGNALADADFSLEMLRRCEDDQQPGGHFGFNPHGGSGKAGGVESIPASLQKQARAVSQNLPPSSLPTQADTISSISARLFMRRPPGGEVGSRLVQPAAMRGFRSTSAQWIWQPLRHSRVTNDGTLPSSRAEKTANISRLWA